MSDDFVGLNSDGTGKKVDNSKVSSTILGGFAYRQRVSLGDPVDGTKLAVVSAAPSPTDAGLVVRPIPPSGVVASLPDVIPSSPTPAAFSSLPRGPNGILVTCHSLVGSGSVRVGGSDTTTTQGQPFTNGSSYQFQVDNANLLKYALESGSGLTLCVTAV